MGKEYIEFRRWSRKKYGVFNSLGRVVKICTLSLAYGIIVIQVSGYAQVVSDSLKVDNYEIGEVVVNPGQPPSGVGAAEGISVIITRSEIELSPAQNLNDLLRYIAGVDIRQRGPEGVQADISILGGTFDQTIVLLNGINISDAQTGHHNLNIPVDLESIERIEILKGSAAKKYGSALDGAINIITTNPVANNLRLSANAGVYGLRKFSGYISNKGKSLSQALSINNVSSDGYIANTDFSNTNIFYQAGVSPGIGTISFQTGYTRKEFGANSFYSLKYPNQFEATKTEFASLQYESKTLVKISSAIYIRRQRDRFELRRDTIPFNHHLTNNSGIKINGSYTGMLGVTNAGIEIRNEQIISNVLGIPLGEPVPVSGYEGSFYTNWDDRLSEGFWADHLITLNRFSLKAGVLLYHLSEMKGIRVYPGVDMRFRFTNQIELYSSINSSFRNPTFTDLFYKSPVQRAGNNLADEEAITTEGGVSWSGKVITANLNVFNRSGNRNIDWIKSPSSDSTVWRSMNWGHISFTGAEATVTISPAPSNTQRVRSVKISYSYLASGRDNSEMLSRYVFDYLRHQLTISVDLRIAGKFFISNRISYSDRNGTFQNRSGLNQKYQPFWLSDIKVYRESELLTFFVEASNLFNSYYQDFGGIVQPGIWMKCGIVVDIDYLK